MSQEVQQEPAQPGVDGEDLGAGIRRLQAEVLDTRDRYRRMRDVTPKKMMQETEGTVLSFFEDFLRYFGVFFDYMVGAVDDLNDRLEDVEADAVPPLDEEDGDLILELADTCEGFVQLYTETNPNAPAEVKKKLADAALTIANVREWVKERLGEDDAEGDGGEEDDTDDGSNGVNAPGGAVS